MDFRGNHILSIDQFDRKGIEKLFSVADKLEPFASKEKITRVLEGAILGNMFFEPSTRTRISFGASFNLLGGNVREITEVGSSSLAKGESLADTARVLSGYSDIIVMRHPENGSVKRFADSSRVPVINAGDGTNEHPTQALLDYCVIKEIFKKKKIKIGICGDIKHSRVAHSNIKLLSKMGYQIHIIAPTYFLNRNELIKINDKIKFHKNLNYLEKLDVLMMLRVQKERIPKGAKNMMKSFKKEFCLQNYHLLNKPYLMHPGPVNRNIEISDEVLDNYPKSLILKQVEMGVYLRMACLHYILK